MWSNLSSLLCLKFYPRLGNSSLVKSLPDYSWDLQNPHQARVVAALILALRGQRRGIPGQAGWLASLSSHNQQIPGSARSPVSENKVEEWSRKTLSNFSLHMCTHILFSSLHVCPLHTNITHTHVKTFSVQFWVKRQKAEIYHFIIWHNYFLIYILQKWSPGTTLLYYLRASPF